MSQLNVVVLFGGCSPEHEVSLQSAAAVLRNLDRERFCPLPVGISRKGDWFLFSGSEAAIEDGSWLSLPECAPCALLPDLTWPASCSPTPIPWGSLRRIFWRSPGSFTTRGDWSTTTGPT